MPLARSLALVLYCLMPKEQTASKIQQASRPIVQIRLNVYLDTLKAVRHKCIDRNITIHEAGNEALTEWLSDSVPVTSTLLNSPDPTESEIEQ